MKHSFLVGLLAVVTVSCKQREYNDANVQSANNDAQKPTMEMKDPAARTVLEANHKRGVLTGTNHENKPCQMVSHLYDLVDTHGREDNPYLWHFQLRVFFETNASWSERLFDFQFDKSQFRNQLRHQDGTFMGRVILNDKISVVTVKYDQDNMITEIVRHLDGKLTHSCTLVK